MDKAGLSTAKNEASANFNQTDFPGLSLCMSNVESRPDDFQIFHESVGLADCRSVPEEDEAAAGSAKTSGTLSL